MNLAAYKYTYHLLCKFSDHLLFVSELILQFLHLLQEQRHLENKTKTFYYLQQFLGFYSVQALETIGLLVTYDQISSKHAWEFNLKSKPKSMT